MFWARSLVACASLLAAAACQPLPQPFQPEDKDGAAPPLLLPTGEFSLFVTPVGNLSEPLTRTLATALANALVDRELPASAATRSRASSDLVTAIATDENGQAVWVWQVARPSRAPLNGPGYALGMDIERLEGLSGRQLEGIVRGMAASVVQQLNSEQTAQESSAPPAAPPAAGLPKIHLLPFEGAPGDGNRSLAEALARLIANSGLGLVVNDPASADFLIDCSTRMTDAGPAQEAIALTWSLYTPNRTRLGNITQANRVPRGSLNGAWGGVAGAAAEGGLEGLAQILARLRPR